MKPQKLKRTLRKLLTRLSDKGAESQLEFDPDVIHQFRTTFKKTRSLIRFLRYSDARFPNVLKPLSGYYKILGQIRDLQLFEKFSQTGMALDHKGIINGQPDELDKKIAGELIALKISSQKFEINSIYRDCIARLDKSRMPDENQLRLKRYMRLLGSQINLRMSSAPLYENELHASRKLLKDLHYLSLIFGKKFKLDEELETTGQNYQQLMDDLGDLHDAYTFINLKDKFATDHRQFSAVLSQVYEPGVKGIGE